MARQGGPACATMRARDYLLLLVCWPLTLLIALSIICAPAPFDPEDRG